MSLTVRRVGAESAEVVLAIIQDAFGNRPPLDPPAPALSDTVDSIRTRLALDGGFLAKLDNEPVGCVLFEPVGDSVYLRRFGVVSSAQGAGVAGALIKAAFEAFTGHATRLSVVAREELPATVAFWVKRGFTQTDRRKPYVELTFRLPKVHHVPTAAAMQDLGRRIAGDLAPGDLVVLTGDLGAGKTTFTQGLAEGLAVSGAVTSPTFVIAREHAPTGRRPGLVHVDAYRLGSTAELDDLDLDSSLDQVVTVIEWGEGMAEGLSSSRLEVRIRHGEAQTDAAGAPELEPRVVEVQGVGPRWATHHDRRR